MKEQWLIEYRDCCVTSTGINAQVLTAHKVEAWTKDYAFFNHPNRLDQVTKLVPRELVKEIKWLDPNVKE